MILGAARPVDRMVGHQPAAAWDADLRAGKLSARRPNAWDQTTKNRLASWGDLPSETSSPSCHRLALRGPSTTWTGVATLPAIAELAVAARPASAPLRITCIMLANPSMSRPAVQGLSCMMLVKASCSG